MQTPPKILYQGSGYNIERNLLEVPFNRYMLTSKKINPSKILTHINYKLSGSKPIISNSHWEVFKKNNAIWHFFNSISFGKTPWIVSYETSLPRWKTNNRTLLHYGIKALAHNRCKKLIALSKCTKEFQIRYLNENFPSYTDIISKKITVVYPSQSALIETYKNTSNNTLVFTIIGADFFRKGGKEILHVFDDLLSKKAPIQLNIISSLQYGDYASKTNFNDLQKAKKIIAKHRDSIHHYERLPNKKVLEILKDSHIGLLPTYGDTFGYSVLEAQACGCPVITTNLRALPEINSNEYGWVINVPKDKWGNGKIETTEERAKFSQIIQSKLFEIVTDIIAEPRQIIRKGSLALKHIKNDHNPDQAAQKIERIYDKALS